MTNEVKISRAIGVQADNPEALREYVRSYLAETRLAALPYAPELSITMPGCDKKVDYATVDDIPDVDVPCPCGDEAHYMIKYVENPRKFHAPR